MAEKKLTHVDPSGRAKMVDVSQKATSLRTARAEGYVRVSLETITIVRDSGLPKGNPFEVARVAGIQAAKKTSELIPLCHSLNLDFADVDVRLGPEGFEIVAAVTCRRATGVEMEALAAVSIAALTLYDMCKAVDKSIEIGPIRLLEKTKKPIQ